MVKVLVSLDDHLVRRLDEAAALLKSSRSALLRELADQGLGGAVGPGARLEVRLALADLDALFQDAAADTAPADFEDSTDAIRAERDLLITHDAQILQVEGLLARPL